VLDGEAIIKSAKLWRISHFVYFRTGAPVFLKATRTQESQPTAVGGIPHWAAVSKEDLKGPSTVVGEIAERESLIGN
jgi:hypothetical protein